MNSDPASLANLRDIVTLPPVPWWPPAPGWWFLLAVLGLIVLLAAVRGWRHWRANAYRRTALRALREVESLASIAEILKRAALMASPRTQVASLTGSTWVDWLEKTAGRPVPPAVGQALAVGLFTETGADNVGELAVFAAEWIRGHTIDRPAGEGE